ncbi:MAG: aldo/keto reductase, partial [Eubacteriales bacterium]|nr:aldo/keto reductase [Eubacteriales bacterium]
VMQCEVHPYGQQTELKKFLDENEIAIQAWYPLGHGDKALMQEDVFTELAAKYNKSNAQIILKWHIQEGNIVIPGSKNPDHIRANFDLFDFELTADELQRIEALNQDKHYYAATAEMLAGYAAYVPDVDGQK